MIPKDRLAGLSSLALATLLVAPAYAAEISDTAGTLVVTYDETAWTATLREEELDFVCIAPTCGGEAVACNVLTVFPEEPGGDPRGLTGDIRQRLEARLAAMLPGVEPRREVLQDATRTYKGDVVGVSATLRAMANGAAFLVSYFYVVQAGDGVGVASCIAAEKDHALARAAFDALMGGIAVNERPVGSKL